MGVGILGTGAYVPDLIVTNDVAGAAAEVDDAWIRRKTAIRERRWTPPDLATSDLAVRAGRRALAAAGISATQLSTIIVATSTPDRPQPPTAAYVQHALGAGGAAFDLNAVCSGFVFGLATARALVAETAGYALVIGADVYSRILNPRDRRTVVLFGDGAGAVVLGRTAGNGGVLDCRLHTFGHMSELISVPGGGSRQPYSPHPDAEESHYFTMDGRGVRAFVVTELPELVKDFLYDNDVLAHEIDHVVPHQANGVMLGEIAFRLGLTKAVMHRTVTEYGNTGAASIPITLDNAVRAGRIQQGQQVLLVAFGGGMSVGLGLLEWH
ncbi:3-oxoacyl-ACP synthase III family protein [Nocardia sp. NPDC051321]|uniref:3-oxoacyl-ACP synthase III family protein n=1 Tax=Nocardia sp. NPDC051321 TaxID=3364323 RepID=UPI00378A80B8